MAGLTLLLADENSTTRRVVELGVAAAGDAVRILSVTDGEAAIARIESEHPDVILVDIALPKRTGYEVATFVKQNPTLSHIPVVLLVGALEPLDEQRIAACRCDAVLKKPFDPQTLATRVLEWLSHAPQPAHVSALTAAEPMLEPAPPAPEPLPATLAPEPAPEPLPAPAFLSSAPPATEPPAPLAAELPALDTVGAEEDEEARDVPTLRGLLGDTPLTTATETFSLDAALPSPPLPGAAARGPAHASVAEAFRSLLAVEQHETDSVPVSVYALTASMRTDLLVEEITRRVLDRVRHDLRHEVDAAAARVATNIAERIARGNTSP